MIRFRNGFLSVFTIIIFVFSIVFFSFDLEANALSNEQNDALIERIAKDFSKKFCNGVGFGLSEESAINFAMKENIAVFKKKKGIENIDTKAIAEKVSHVVADKCGYLLNLSDNEWGQTFRKGELN